MIDTVLKLKLNFHVLFIDDNSPDGTAKLIELAIEKNPGRIFIEKREGKLGLGTAYIHGFKWAIEKNMTLFLKWIVIFLIILLI
jgi:dolichol-phosphate mannosyltransferase